MARDVKHRKQ